MDEDASLTPTGVTDALVFASSFAQATCKTAPELMLSRR